MNEEAQENGERLKKQQKLIKEALEEAGASKPSVEDIEITSSAKKSKKENAVFLL